MLGAAVPILNDLVAWSSSVVALTWQPTGTEVPHRIGPGEVGRLTHNRELLISGKVPRILADVECMLAAKGVDALPGNPVVRIRGGSFCTR